MQNSLPDILTGYSEAEARFDRDVDVDGGFVQIVVSDEFPQCGSNRWEFLYSH